LFEFISYSCALFGITPFVIAITLKKPFVWRNPAIPIFLLTAISSVYELIFTYLMGINASIWFQLYSLLIFISIFYFFWKKLSKHHKVLIRLFCFGFSIAYLISFSFWSSDSFLISTSINNLYTAFFVLLCSILWIKKLFNDIENKEIFDNFKFVNLYENNEFYIIAGLFIYYAVTLFLFLSSNFISRISSSFYNYWIVNIIATLILRLFLIISAWKLNKA